MTPRPSWLVEMERTAKAASRVVAWYPHGPGDGYHPGRASVRGPFGRWFLVEGGERGTPDGKLGDGIASLEDDAKFAAVAMNNVLALLALVEELAEALKKFGSAYNGEIATDALAKFQAGPGSEGGTK